MLDNPRKTELLIAGLKEVLPIPTSITPRLGHELSKQSPDIPIPARCNVIDVLYAGDMGGILCSLDIGGANAEKRHLVSITHLAFNRNTPHSREIESYQRHRNKKLKEQQGRLS